MLGHTRRRSKLLPVAKVLGGNAGRWLAAGLSVVVSAAMFYAQSHETSHHAATPAASPTSAPAAPPPNMATPAEAELLAASAPVADAASFQFALLAGDVDEHNLQIHTI